MPPVTYTRTTTTAAFANQQEGLGNRVHAFGGGCRYRGKPARRAKSRNQVTILLTQFQINPKPKKAEIKDLVSRYAAQRRMHCGAPRDPCQRALPTGFRCCARGPGRATGDRTGLTYTEVCRWFRNQRIRSRPQSGDEGKGLKSADGGDGVGVHGTLHHPASVGSASGALAPPSGVGAAGVGAGVGARAGTAAASAVSSVAGSSAGLAGAAGGGGAGVLPEAHGDGSLPIYMTGGLADFGEREEDKHVWRNTARFRRSRDNFMEIVTEFPKGSPEREQLLRDLVRCLGRSDREALQACLRPRGPYRGSADPQLKLTTTQERSKEARGRGSTWGRGRARPPDRRVGATDQGACASHRLRSSQMWAEMERRFGAGVRPAAEHVDLVDNGLDPNMLEGLKVYICHGGSYDLQMHDADRRVPSRARVAPSAHLLKKISSCSVRTATTCWRLPGLWRSPR